MIVFRFTAEGREMRSDQLTAEAVNFICQKLYGAEALSFHQYRTNKDQNGLDRYTTVVFFKAVDGSYTNERFSNFQCAKRELQAEVLQELGYILNQC